MSESSVFEVILGTYEEYVLGYKFIKKELKQTFATHSHTSSVKCIAASDIFVATGGTDDRIVIYDMRLRKEHCILSHHNATVTCLQFTPDNTHLISGSSDGAIAIVRVGNWQLEKMWEKSHKGKGILDIAIHSSGKLALSLGADCTLQTWNLIKGRQAYVINLNSKSKDAKSMEHVNWAPCGTRFSLTGGKYSEIWSIEKGGLLRAVEHSSKVTSSVWLSDDALLVGYENGKLATVCTDTGNLQIHEGHDSRIKGIVLNKNKIITASSSGDIIVWNKDFVELSKVSAGCRLICLCLVPTIVIKEENISEKHTIEETVIEKHNMEDEGKEIKKKRKKLKKK